MFFTVYSKKYAIPGKEYVPSGNSNVSFHFGSDNLIKFIVFA